MTLLNSNFEDWRRANPAASMNEFQFSFKKMSISGALFDIQKLYDVCKDVVSRMSAEEVYDNVLAWAKDNDPEFYEVLAADKDYAIANLGIGRGGKKPRKDFGHWSEVKDYMGFFFDKFFTSN